MTPTAEAATAPIIRAGVEAIDGPHPVAVEVTVKLTALAIREADGRYLIVVPALPGCFSEAATIDEVGAQVVDAAEGWLASMHESEKEQAVRDCLP